MKVELNSVFWPSWGKGEDADHFGDNEKVGLPNVFSSYIFHRIEFFTSFGRKELFFCLEAIGVPSATLKNNRNENPAEYLYCFNVWLLPHRLY
ncbi:hypothetical protein JZ751_023490 [Albula glossodonta]|uniref:Uncharacterized protein n=1 Tax=Albula glossodonta TaxID=121402 RepID=A0A8T2NH62_9TELE|nr:hypothetical protein JZ751_023490 [Albula glossodonta]